MNDIAPRLGPHLQPKTPAVRDSADAKEAAPFPAEARTGLGPLNTRHIAVGSGQSTQRLVGSPGMLAGTSPRVRALLCETIPAGNAILRLKERLLGHGGPQDPAYLRAADRATRRL